MEPSTARLHAVTAGAFTSVAGLLVLTAPAQVARWAGLRNTRPLLAIGISDLALAPGLLAMPNKRPWLIARAAANVVAAAVLAPEPAPIPRVIATTLGGLAVADLVAAHSLRPPTAT